MFQKIVVSIDGSEPSSRALAAAVDERQRVAAERAEHEIAEADRRRAIDAGGADPVDRRVLRIHVGRVGVGDLQGGAVADVEDAVARVGRGPLDVSIADVDGDGTPEVLAANNFSNNVSVVDVERLTEER